MYRYAAFGLFLAFGVVFQLSRGTEVKVKDNNDKLCLYANLMVNFSVYYNLDGNKTATAEFELPEKVATNGSKCDVASSFLKLSFGEGHSWSMNFTISDKMYQADSITFSYNLSDTTFFPNSTSNDTRTVTVKPNIRDVGLDTCYSCKSNDMIEAGLVNQTLWNVLMQAFVTNDSRSGQNTTCAADVPTTPVAPTTHTTNTTTTAPVTNATSTVPPTTPTTPTPTLPPPTVGKYSVKTSVNGTICLLANFGLRIGYGQGNKQEEMNFDPNGAKFFGSCGVNSSELVLESNTTTLVFTFINDTNKFRLHALNVTGKTSSGVEFSQANTNLSLWEAAVSSSYMCNKEQNYNITDMLTIFTFGVRVQPFGVKKDDFSTAQECSLDDTSILIPIIVGAALAGLILIVVIAYVIGRRKTYVGYQTL